MVAQLNPSDDFKTAIAIYEAFQGLTPIQASDERLWTYLSHVDFYSYMIKRWPKVYNGEELEKGKNTYILNRWFIQTSSHGSLIKSWISGLWWSVYLSVDENRTNKYELTKILFRQQDIRTRTMGAEKFGRHKEAVIGIFEFIKENEKLFRTKFEPKTRFIARHINLMGGTRILSYFNRNFFKTELQKVKRYIEKI